MRRSYPTDTDKRWKTINSGGNQHHRPIHLHRHLDKLGYRSGQRPHLYLYYRLVTHRGRRGERRSLSEADYAALLSAAHQQLRAPIILIWDNLKCATRRSGIEWG